MSGGLPHSEKPFVGQMREQVFCVTVAIDEFSWFAYSLIRVFTLLKIKSKQLKIICTTQDQLAERTPA